MKTNNSFTNVWASNNESLENLLENVLSALALCYPIITMLNLVRFWFVLICTMMIISNLDFPI